MTPRPAPVPNRPREEKIREPHPIDARRTENTVPPAETPPAPPVTPQTAPPPPLELKTYSTRLPVPTIERLRLAAFRSRHSQQDLIIAALDAYLPPLPEE